jgi:hypothetical protein
LFWKPIGVTTDSIPAADDPRRLLTDMRALAQRVRLDQRMTWVALLVLTVVTFLAIPFDWFGMQVDCLPEGPCHFARWGVFLYWPPASLLAYAAIAVCYLRAARQRGLGARVLPYVITGVVTTAVFSGAWVATTVYFAHHPLPAQPLPYWWFALDRLVGPWGMIGVALLVLAWLERNRALLLFTVAYLALVVLVLPMSDGFGPTAGGIRAGMAVPQFIAGGALLLGTVGFRAADRRHR